MTQSGSYKDTHTLEQRQREAKKVQTRAPDRIPIICEKAKEFKAPNVEPIKLLVPPQVTVAGIMDNIRRRINLDAEQSIFLSVAGTVASGNVPMSDLYSANKDEDGFLYVTYSGENTYG